MIRRRHTLALLVSLGVVLGAGAVAAQQPPPGGRVVGQPVPVNAGKFGGSGAQPLGAPPPRPGGGGFPQMGGQPGGAPRGPGGFPPGGAFPPSGGKGGRPGNPPAPTRGRPSRRSPDGIAVGAEESAEPEGERECPGYGPADKPRAPNWWRGILMVNNELAQSTNPLLQLLFRYENAANPCDEKNDPPPFLAAVLNFAVLALIAYRFGRKPLNEALVKRKQTIMHDIETAAALKQQAEERLHEYEARFAQIGEKLSEIRADYAAQAEQERARILADAVQYKERVRRDAELRLEQELKAAREAILRQATEASVLAAEKLISRHANAGDLDRLSIDYLAAIGPAFRDVGAAANEGGA